MAREEISMKKNTIKFYQEDNPLMNDSIDRIVVQVHNYKKTFNKKMILLTGCGTACGVTTTSINLAVALSLSGWRTLLIDCDIRKGNKYKRVGEEITIGLAEYLNKEVEQDEIINKTNYEFLDYISCGDPYKSPVRLLCSSEMTTLMESVRVDYDYIILDTPSINIVPDADIIFPYVDGIILLAALNQTTKKQLWDAKKQVAKHNGKYYGLIINQVDMGEYTSYIKDYDYFSNHKMDKRYKRDIKLAKRKKKDSKEENHV